MNSLASVAERTGCAVVLVGHMNKSASGKGIYRGLGSIDITAAARSVLLVGRVAESPNVRAVAHIKSNLAPEGDSVAFELNPECGFRWLGKYEITADELLGGILPSEEPKAEQAQKIILSLFSNVTELSTEAIYAACFESGISERTVERVKKAIGAKAVRMNNKWYWVLPQAVEDAANE
ncbi:hypothetical protein FACS1894211_14470 [Clostridia bacterium]|nr:hypothetical protein FACS1894211_14470 [Clostridia bacterium]